MDFHPRLGFSYFWDFKLQKTTPKNKQKKLLQINWTFITKIPKRWNVKYKISSLFFFFAFVIIYTCIQTYKILQPTTNYTHTYLCPKQRYKDFIENIHGFFVKLATSKLLLLLLFLRYVTITWLYLKNNWSRFPVLVWFFFFVFVQ